MKRAVLIILWCSCIHQVCWARSKYNEDDEDNPYEFGFTIDGQQHRHEKKDANGIIQGEFGFITADGVYHVTVYATDEDGNFKILSMRNVKISGPLDEPNAKLPETSQFTKENPSNVVAPTPNPLSINPSPPPVQGITTSRSTGQFTTQSTIKPACAGCGYVTLKPPGSKDSDHQKLTFQTPAFQRPKPGTVVIGAELEEKSKLGIDQSKAPIAVSGLSTPVSVLGLPKPVIVPSLPASVTDGPSLFTSSILQQNRPNYYNNDQHPNNYSQSNHNYDHPQQFSLPDKPVIAANIYDQNMPNNNRVPIVEPFANPLAISNPFTDAPPTGIIVTNTEIKVPNGSPIPIQDKYPNMKDGLPEGISKDDITGILYKFNYTVGFHGHYEKGYKSGAKVGGYFVTDRDGVSRIVTYVADENGYRPKVKFIRLDLNSDLVPKEDSEKKFGLKNFEFVWYPIQ